MTKRARGRVAAPDTLTVPYLQNKARIATILGSFLILALPLAAVQLSGINSTAKFSLLVAYAVLLGGTHFLITLAVYFHRDNLQYFTSSAGRVATYFVVPIALMALFFLISYFNLNADRPDASLEFLVYTVLFTLSVRAADFYHVVRQSFGMLQLFKAQTPATFPSWMRRADNTFFISMAGLQLVTFARGVRTGRAVFEPDTLSLIALTIILISLGGVIAGFISAARTSTRPRALWLPATYFLFQAASASLAAVRSELYTASLAMHYVEYHVVIFPRLFGFELHEDSRADRIAGWMRQHKFVFYAALALLACFVSRELWPAIMGRLGSPSAPWLLFNLLSGIFVVHYFVEAFIWKFRNPFYRQSLSPLYFPTGPTKTARSA